MALVAHFKMDGNTNNELPGYTNSPTNITYTNQGKIGGSAIFALGSHATFASSFYLNHNTNWTVSIWIKTTAAGIVSILGNQSGGPVYSDIRLNAGKMAYYHYNNAWLEQVGTIVVNDGRWHHLAWVNFPNGTMNMYVDGVLDLYRTDSSLSSVNAIDRIGRNWNGDAQNFIGQMDDLKIFTGTLITENEILNMSFNKKLFMHFPFNGNIDDYTNSFNTTSASITYTASGKIGQALNLNGSSTYIQPTGFDGTSISSFSMAFWIYNINSGEFNAISPKYKLLVSSAIADANDVNVTCGCNIIILNFWEPRSEVAGYTIWYTL